MPKQNPLLNIVKKQKEGKAVAIYSCCSSNAFVIEAAMETAKKQDSCVLIESTANQVDQNGGYSGMTPKDFFNFCHEKALKCGLTCKCHIEGKNTTLFMEGDKLCYIKYYLATLLKNEYKIDGIKRLISIIFT